MSSSSDEDSEIQYIPNEIENELENAAALNVLPERSQALYLKAYKNFVDWKKAQNCQTSENNLIVYFEELRRKYMPSTLWTQYSMLKAVLNLEEKIDIGSYKKLLTVLSSYSKGYKPQKAEPFTPEEVRKFLDEAPDDVHLANKVALIFGICGCCRTDELYNIKIQDIEKQGEILLVQISVIKNKSTRFFTISKAFVPIVDKYTQLRPRHAAAYNYFLNYQKGKCTVQVLGKKKIGQMPQKIAEFLGLENSKKYTGHTFRRTAASLFADSGANMFEVQHFGGWQSSNSARGYVDDSNQRKRKAVDRISDTTSNEWIRSIKNRNSIRVLKPCGQIFTSDAEIAEKFRTYFCNKIAQENLLLENIYSADEAGFRWRLLNNVTIEAFNEEKEESEEKFTGIFCSNATGSNRIQLMAIGQFANLSRIQNKQLPLIYKENSTGRMDRSLFTEWYTDVFIKNVLKHQKRTNTSGKVILLLDDAPVHPKAEELNKINENFKVIYLSSNISSALQPMEQGIIAATKKSFKSALLRNLLLTDNIESAERFLKIWNLFLALKTINDAWSTLKTTTLQNAWRKLLGKTRLDEIKDKIELTDDTDFSSVCNEFSNFLIPTEQTSEEREKCREKIHAWILRDNYYDCGWSQLKDLEIIKSGNNQYSDTEKNIKMEIVDEDIIEYHGNSTSSCQQLTIMPQESSDSISSEDIKIENVNNSIIVFPENSSSSCQQLTMTPQGIYDSNETLEVSDSNDSSDSSCKSTITAEESHESISTSRMSDLVNSSNLSQQSKNTVEKVQECFEILKEWIENDSRFSPLDLHFFQKWEPFISQAIITEQRILRES